MSIDFDIGLLDVPGILMVVLDPQGLILLWNQACSTLTGYSLSEVRNHPPWDVLVPEEEGLELRRRFTCALPGERLQLDHHWVSRSGERRWICWSCFAAPSLQGGVDYVVGIGVDRTDSKRNEEALRLSQERLAGIVSIASDAIISLDERARIVIFNEGAEAIFGYRADEVIGQPLDLLIPPRLREIHRQHVHSFATSEARARKMAERRPAIYGLRKSGDEFPAEAAISKISVGGALCFTVVLRDVTERKRRDNGQALLAGLSRALQVVRDYRGTLATLVEIPLRDFADGCMIATMPTETDSALTTWMTTGSVPEQTTASREFVQRLLGNSHAQLYAEDRAAALTPLFEDCGAGPLTLLDHARKGSLMVVPMMARENLIGTLVLSSSHSFFDERDLTTASQFAERAALAVENALLFAKAKDAVLARDEVLGIVAHDLRNPLNTIRLSASILKRHCPGDIPENIHRAIDTIFRGSARAEQLIEDILDVRRLEEGRLHLSKTTLPPNAMIEALMPGQSAIAAAAGIALQRKLDENLPNISADKERMAQVFENLIGNAVKFTSQGGTITLGAEVQQAEILFWVADTGQGMTPEQVAHLFDRSWRPAQQDKRRGIGLGLPICKGIIEAHGGRLWATSTAGKGSTFFFTLPKAAAVQA